MPFFSIHINIIAQKSSGGQRFKNVLIYHYMSKIITNEDKIKDILTRGVEEIFIKEDLLKKLQSGKQLRVKLGIDPTSPYIHLGRAVTLHKLRAFQDLGHQVVLIIGDYTAKIGDPSDKLEKRPMLLDDKQIKKNLKGYLKQAGLILDIKKTEVKYNSSWFKKMNFLELSQLLECFTVQQMSKRRNFKERLDAGSDVFVVEFLYPALQGYDSIMVNADVEIGGYDQLFNLKAGRVVQKKYGQKEQDIMTLTMLEGTDGRKMSSSWGNIISVIDFPEEMFGKVMSIKDDLIIKYFLLTTNLSLPEIEKIAKDLAEGANPKDLKTKLAFEIVKIYHGEKKAQEAQKNWEKVFSKKEIPEEILKIETRESENFGDVLLKNRIVSSKSEFRRLVDEGAITNLDKDEKVSSYYEKIKPGVYRIGKKRFVKIILK
jgi:tyrosyl-tRNA synthetase